MPEKRFDPTSRTFYLDTSTISHAYKAEPPEFGRLKPWIEHVARTQNLCVSFVHAAEFGDLMPDSDRTAFVEWFDRLPIVWVATKQPRAEHAEVEAWLKAAIGLSPARPYQPFHARGFTMAQLIDVARSMGWGRLKRLGFHMTQLVREDLQAIEEDGVSPEALEALRQARTRDVLRGLAREANARLAKKRDVDWYLWTRRAIDFEQRFVELYEKNTSSFRTFRVSNAGIRYLGENAKKRAAGGNAEGKELEGSSGDLVHATAGAYCDVFTCDRATSEWVAPLRKQFGVGPPIVLGGHVGRAAGFVEELIATSR